MLDVEHQQNENYSHEGENCKIHLENTVQKMYKVYDSILEKQKKLKESAK